MTEAHVAVKNTEMLGVAMATQRCAPFTLLSSYKLFRITVNNMKEDMSSCTTPDI
jgi:hypothetical protein